MSRTAWIGLASAALAVSMSAAASASESVATMGISVTVARSCIVEAQPLDGGASAVRLVCSRGQQGLVLLGHEVADSRLALPAGMLRVEPPSDGSPDVRAVTLNF